MILTRTPFRISLFGGGTDYPVWFRRHGGAALAFAIDKYCYISCRYLPPFFEHHSRIIYSRVENVTDNQSIEHPSVRACLKFLQVESGLEIHHDADLPARSGLGSSSAFTVGLLHALHALLGRMPPPGQLAQEAITIEQDWLGENVGVQDQLITAYGGLRKLEFSADGELWAHPLPLSSARIRELESHLCLCFTGFSRWASEVAAEQIANTPQRTRELSEMAELVNHAIAKLCDSRVSMAELGPLLDHSWRLKRSLSHRISTPQIDELYALGMQAGALGGKILGAGGGGFMLFWVPPERQQNFRAALPPLIWVPVSIVNSGSQLVYFQPQDSYHESFMLQRKAAYAHNG